MLVADESVFFLRTNTFDVIHRRLQRTFGTTCLLQKTTFQARVRTSGSDDIARQ